MKPRSNLIPQHWLNGDVSQPPACSVPWLYGFTGRLAGRGHGVSVCLSSRSEGDSHPQETSQAMLWLARSSKSPEMETISG